MIMRNRKIFLLSSIILIAALTRFLAPWPNVTPLGAMALLGGAYFERKWLAVIVPVAALWISDLFFNNFIYNTASEGFVWFGQSFWWVGGAMAMITLMGSRILNRRSFVSLAGSSVLASLLFFLVTNFGVWTSGLLYPMTSTGLLSSYVAGVPFFWNTLAGDLFFVFSLYYVIEFSLNRKVVFQFN